MIYKSQNLFPARAPSGLKKCSLLASVRSPSRGPSFRGEAAQRTKSHELGFLVILSSSRPHPHASLAPAYRRADTGDLLRRLLPTRMRASPKPSSLPPPRATTASSSSAGASPSLPSRAPPACTPRHPPPEHPKVEGGRSGGGGGELRWVGGRDGARLGLRRPASRICPNRHRDSASSHRPTALNPACLRCGAPSRRVSFPPCCRMLLS